MNIQELHIHTELEAEIKETVDLAREAEQQHGVYFESDDFDFKISYCVIPDQMIEFTEGIWWDADDNEIDFTGDELKELSSLYTREYFGG
jgi:hypothetical protein